MVETFLVLIGLQLLGEWLARWLHIPVPGPVLGMLLLFVGLCLRRGVPTALQHGVPAFCSICRCCLCRLALACCCMPIC